MKLAYKLFGALFLILILVVGATGVLRYLVARNFKDFIRQVEIQRLNSIVPLLQEEYRAGNGWSAIENNARYWRKLIRKEMNAPDFPGPAPPRMGPPGRMQPPEKGPEHKPPRRKLRYLLSDARLKPIIGHPQPGDDRQLVAIQVDGKTVGWLGLAKRPPIEKGPPEIFIKQQIQQLYILGGVVVVITALVALLLTRHLLTPVKRLAEGTRELAGRNFSIRIPKTGRDELGQLAENFNTMAETLENFENMRRQWLTDISHELRTPLAVLRGEIESLLDGVRRPTLENLASLHLEILRVNRLVEDLHLLSMADSNALQLNKQSVTPVKVLEKTIAAFASRFDHHHVRLDLLLQDHRSVLIQGDDDRLGQVFTNILENAVKYVPPKGRLTIAASTENGFLTISFTDTGPGVPEEALPRLFQRLYRVDPSRGRDTGGSGLGLSICKHIVALHGGRIWAQNNIDGGLTVLIRLPLSQPDRHTGAGQ